MTKDQEKFVGDIEKPLNADNEHQVMEKYAAMLRGRKAKHDSVRSVTDKYKKHSLGEKISGMAKKMLRSKVSQ
jgi:hypothetical protein